MGCRSLIVLDAHVLVWWLGQAVQVISTSSQVIKQASADNAVAASAVSLFEIATSLRPGRLRFAVDGEKWFAALQTIPELIIEPVSAEIAWHAGTYPAGIPGDSADRMIAATAHVLSAKLVSAEEKLRSARSVNVVW